MREFKGNKWMKKGKDLFDIAIGAYDGAKVCELAVTFLLKKLIIYYSEICNKSEIGLYREDGLSIFGNKSGTQLEKIKEKLQSSFKEYDLEITAESNQQVVNYLNVSLNLNDGTFSSTINLLTKYSTFVQNLITRKILSNIYQSLMKIVSQTYLLVKCYSKNQQHTTKIICRNLNDAIIN